MPNTVPEFVSERAFTVTNGALGPVMWCPACDEQIGYLSNRVSIGVLLADARRHRESCRLGYPS